MTSTFTHFYPPSLFYLDSEYEEYNLLCQFLDNNEMLNNDLCYYYQINKPFHMYEVLSNFLFVMGLMFMSTVLFMTFYGYVLYPYFDERRTKLEREIQYMYELENELKEVPYTDRYPIEYSSQKYEEKSTDVSTNNEKEDNAHFLNALKVSDNCFVAESTPEGFVIMKYNYDEEGFEYWANKSISFKNLDTVARKFVTLYQMRDLYICNDLESKSDSETDTETDNETTNETDADTDAETTNDTATESQPNPFATFKSYNISKSNTVNGANIVKNNKQTNKFIHKGKINDLDITQQEKYEESKPNATMTFASFKSMFYSS